VIEVIVYASCLLVLPGAWLSHTRACRGLPRGLRLPAAVILSPFVLSAELVLCIALGVSFPAFVRWVAPLNLTAAALIWRDRRAANEDDADHRAPWPEMLAAAALAVPLAIVLIALPIFRQYGWHNMMQLAAIEQFDRLPALPEEMDAAGLRLNYGWLGFTQIATISRVLDASPMRVFPAVNFAQFVAMFMFCVAATRRLAGVERRLAAVTTAAALLLPGVLDIFLAAWSPPFISGGELRITPMTSKFMYLDAMVVGLSTYSIVVYAAVRCVVERCERLFPVMVIAALACALSYPLLFPACFVVIGLFAAAALVAPRAFPNAPAYPRRAVVLLLASLGGVAVIAFGYVATLGAAAVSRPIRLAHGYEIRQHLWQIALVFGSLTLVAPSMLMRSLRTNFFAYLSLASIFGALSACFLVFVMPRDVEYKFLFAALFVVAPMAAVAISEIASLLRRPSLASVVLVCLLAATSVSLSRWHVPRAWLAKAVPLDETTRAVHPASDWTGSWMAAVRSATPADTVLIAPDSDQPIAVFTQRAVYLAFDGTDTLVEQPGRAGYAMKRDALLESVKGYSPQEIQRRRDIVRQCLGYDAPADVRAILNAFVELRRPVALHVVRPSAFSTWLREHQVGRAIYDAGGDAVWLVDESALRASAAGVSPNQAGRFPQLARP
jgi:hypothetical protein